MKTLTRRTAVRHPAMLFDFDRLLDDFDLLNDHRCAIRVLKLRATRRTMRERVFEHLVNLRLVERRAKCGFVTFLAALFFLRGIVAVFVLVFFGFTMSDDGFEEFDKFFFAAANADSSFLIF
jgi:hypothetical protein